MNKSVGILGIGRYLPQTVRRNDWWPEHVVARWRDKRAQNITKADSRIEAEMTEGLRRTLAALNALGDDPFQGAVERRIVGENETVADMETAAAEEAIERAGISKRDIDFVFSHSMTPEYINVPSACEVHKRLGLRENCFSVNPDAVCNSFVTHLTLAEAMISSGRARYGLLTQSSALTRLAPQEDPVSVCFGDGATAVVVGPVSDGNGLLGYEHRTDGELAHALVATAPGGRWYDEGRVTAVSLDPHAGRQMLFGVAERGREVVHAALARCNLAPSDVSFYASHQATKWFRPVTQDYFDLSHARTVDTFPYLASLSSANLPMVLWVAEREKLLKDGDIVATYSGGTGMTWSSLVLRWGR